MEPGFVPPGRTHSLHTDDTLRGKNAPIYLEPELPGAMMIQEPDDMLTTGAYAADTMPPRDGGYDDVDTDEDEPPVVPCIGSSEAEAFYDIATRFGVGVNTLPSSLYEVPRDNSPSCAMYDLAGAGEPMYAEAADASRATVYDSAADDVEMIQNETYGVPSDECVSTAL